MTYEGPNLDTHAHVIDEVDRYEHGEKGVRARRGTWGAAANEGPRKRGIRDGRGIGELEGTWMGGSGRW